MRGQPLVIYEPRRGPFVPPVALQRGRRRMAVGGGWVCCPRHPGNGASYYSIQASKWTTTQSRGGDGREITTKESQSAARAFVVDASYMRCSAPVVLTGGDAGSGRRRPTGAQQDMLREEIVGSVRGQTSKPGRGIKSQSEAPLRRSQWETGRSATKLDREWLGGPLQAAQASQAQSTMPCG